MLCVVMKVLSHVTAKTKKKGFKVYNFALLLLGFKQHHDSEGVKLRVVVFGVNTDYLHRAARAVLPWLRQ